MLLGGGLGHHPYGDGSSFSFTKKIKIKIRTMEPQTLPPRVPPWPPPLVQNRPPKASGGLQPAPHSHSAATMGAPQLGTRRCTYGGGSWRTRARAERFGCAASAAIGCPCAFASPAIGGWCSHQAGGGVSVGTTVARAPPARGGKSPWRRHPPPPPYSPFGRLCGRARARVVPPPLSHSRWWGRAAAAATDGRSTDAGGMCCAWRGAAWRKTGGRGGRGARGGLHCVDGWDG